MIRILNIYLVMLGLVLFAGCGHLDSSDLPSAEIDTPEKSSAEVQLYAARRIVDIQLPPNKGGKGTDKEPPTIPALDMDFINGGANYWPQACRGFWLGWQASEDNGIVAGYEVWRKDESTSTTSKDFHFLIEVPAQTLTHEDVINKDWAYSYKVRAFDAAGNLSDFSAEIFRESFDSWAIGTCPAE